MYKNLSTFESSNRNTYDGQLFKFFFSKEEDN